MSSQPDQSQPTCEFEEVRNQELKLIASRRAAASKSASESMTSMPLPAGQELSGELTGLALSGGGVRSAAFNLGLLQGLYEKDLLRQVDYMSTVSGGGYVGAHLSSIAMHPDSEFSWQNPTAAPTQCLIGSNESPRATAGTGPAVSKSPPPTCKSYCAGDDDPVAQTLGKGDEGIRANAIGVIARNCRLLTQPSHFLNRQLIGALCLNVVTISGLVMFASLVAWGFRTLDSQPAIRFLYGLKIQGDVARAMLPALLLFGLWLFSWAVAFFRDRENAKGEVAKVFLLSWIAAFFLGVAALAGTGDVSISPYFDAKFGINYSDTVTSFFKQIGTAGLLAIMGGLLPYLHPRALIRSATVNRRGLQGLVYRTATKAMLFGVPLMLFGYIASEDIADSNLSRMEQIFPDDVARAAERSKKWDPAATSVQESKEETFPGTWGLRQKRLEYNTASDLHVVSISNHAEFWQMVETSAVEKSAAKPSPAITPANSTGAVETRSEKSPAQPKDILLFERSTHSIPQRLAHQLKQARKSATARHKQVDPLSKSRQAEEDFQMESYWGMGFSCLRYLIGDDGTLFENQLERKVAIAEGNDAIAQQINKDILANASLYRSLEISSPESLNAFADSLMAKEKDAKKISEIRQARDLIQTAISLENELIADWIKIKARIDGALPLNAVTKTEDDNTKANNATEQFKEAFQNESINKIINPSQDRQLNVEQILEAFSKVRPNYLPSDTSEDLQERLRRLVKLGEHIRKNNRQILEFYCLDYLKPHTTVYATIVQPQDQSLRLKWAMIAGGIWLLSSGLISLNAISLQGVYRDALSQAWIVDPTKKRGSSMNLHEMNEVAAHGCPYHLITGAMSFGAQFGFTSAPDPFLFSPLFCGSETTGYVRSSRYAFGSLTLADAMAISGAAVAPLQIDDPLGRILLTLANFRMGTWLPNPLKPCWHIDLAELPVVPQILLRLWTSYPQTAGRVHLQWILWQWFLPHKQTPFLYLSDGGHFENLGIGELLKRRCRVIIASDAGEDSEYKFEDFYKTAHMGKSRIRIEEINQHRNLFVRLVPDATTKLSERHFVILKIEYLDDAPAVGQCRESYVIYIKPTLTGDEDPGLRGFRSLNPEFPQDPTANQLFEDDKFEAYRRLGYHIALQLSEDLKGNSAIPFWLGKWTPSNGPKNPPVQPMPAAAAAEVPDDLELGEDVARLIRIARDPNEEQWQRFFATRVLAADHSQLAIETLKDLVNDPDSAVACSAVMSFTLASESSVLLLIHGLSSLHRSARAEALRHIKECCPDELKSQTDDLLTGLRGTLRGKTKGQPRPASVEMLKDGVEILERLFLTADKGATRQRIFEFLKEVHALLDLSHN